MAKDKAASPQIKRKGSKFTITINVIFIVLAVISLIVACLTLIPPTAKWLDSLVGDWTRVDSSFGNWVYWHVVKTLELAFPFRGRSEFVTTIFYFDFWLTFLLLLIYLLLTPFMVMAHNKKLGRVGKFRKVLCWIVFAVFALIFIGYLSYSYKFACLKYGGAAYSWFPNAYDSWNNLFDKDGALYVLNLSRYIKFLPGSLWFNSTVYIILMMLIFQLIMFVCACRIKPHAVQVETEVAQPVEDNTVTDDVETDNTPVPVPVLLPLDDEETPQPVVASVNQPSAPVKAERVVPTLRELALLNSLEPIEFSPVSNLPGLYDTDVESLIDLLEPHADYSLTEIELASKDAIEANKLSDDVKRTRNSVQVLPGIDEWDASPWEEENCLVDKYDEELPNPFVEPTPVVIPSEPEVTEAEVEAEPEVETSDIEEQVEEAIQTPEEVVEPIEPEAEVPVAPVEEELTEEKIVEEVPAVEEPVEPVLEEKTDRSELKLVKTDNSREEDVVTTEFAKKNEWVLPSYDPEADKAQPEEQEIVEEKPVQPAKPVANVKQVPLKPVINSNPSPRPTIAPITPVAPVKPVEEPTVVEKEEPVLAPIAGPLHSTEKSKHEKIEVVKPKKVKFELRNYQIKTYQGDISPEEAFRKGVTKVQPTVNPVFANQVDVPAWKAKKRDEEIRKNGYTDVQVVEKLDGVKPTGPSSVKSAPVSSIREMVKAQKNNNEKPVEEEKKEEKIAKPITPIKPITPVKPVATEEKVEDKQASNDNPFSEQSAPVFHPIAPIQKKPSKRPDIKPVDPFKKK